MMLSHNGVIAFPLSSVGLNKCSGSNVTRYSQNTLRICYIEFAVCKEYTYLEQPHGMKYQSAICQCHISDTRRLKQ